MLSLALTAAVAVLQTAQPAWTWTLYADGSPVVLANEAPDTPLLRSTLECERGSGAARLTVYGLDGAGMAQLAAGDAAAVAEARPGRGESLQLMLRTDHPVVTAFALSGALKVTLGDVQKSVDVPREHLPTLRRFLSLCSG